MVATLLFPKYPFCFTSVSNVSSSSILSFVPISAVVINRPKIDKQLDNPISPSLNMFFLNALKAIQPAKMPVMNELISSKSIALITGCLAKKVE